MTRSAELRLLVLLGTDHHPFDRLVRWVERLELRDVDHRAVLVQRGYTSAPEQPRWEYVDFLPHHQLAQLLGRAAAVVTHGGPGTIVDCRKAGLVPVVVPRAGSAGEHVDDHQQLYSHRLRSAGVIERATTWSEFESCVAQALKREPQDLSTLDEVAVSASVERLERLIAQDMRRRQRK